MNFDEWIDYEASRILRVGNSVSEEHRQDYMKVQITAALRKAYAHGRDGLDTHDEPRASSEY
jgi:hypothetical protein